MAKIPKAPAPPPKLLRSINNVLEFGKYKGCTIQYVMKKDPNWIHWAIQNIRNFELNRNAKLLLPPKSDPRIFDHEDWKAMNGRDY